MHGDPERCGTPCSTGSPTSPAAFLRSQVEAGAEAVQLFDSWVGALSPPDYRRYVLPHSAKVLAARGRARRAPHPLRRRHRRAARRSWPRPAPTSSASTGACPLDAAPARLGAGTGVQGNLDPARAVAPWDGRRGQGGATSWPQRRRRPGHVFNLGHGVLPETDPDMLTRLVELVHELPVEKRAAGRTDTPVPAGR